MSGNSDIDAAVRILESFGWNLEKAVDSLLDENFGITEADHGLPGPSNQFRLPTSRPPPPINSSTSNGVPRATWKSIFTKPVYWGFRIIWKVVTLALALLPFGNFNEKRLRSGLTDRELSIAYQREFDDKYGATGLRFFVGSYMQAMDKAKAELKFLLVVLQSDEHDDAESFCRNTLLSPQFVEYILSNDIIVWMGNVAETQGYKVSIGLEVRNYPFMALFALHENKMKLVLRFEGLHPPQQCKDSMDIVIRRMQPTYRAAKTDRYSPLM